MQTSLMNDTVEEFATAKSYVLRFLAEHPSWRDLPNWKFQLQFRAWCIYKEYKPVDPETVRRVRQKLQNTMGLYPKSDEAKKIFQERAEVIKEWIAYL